MNPNPEFQGGDCYRIVVSSAQEAAEIIRNRFGPSAQVLSVRTIEPSGLSRLWASPKLEVIARVDGAAGRSGQQEAHGGPSGAVAGTSADASAGSVAAESAEEASGVEKFPAPAPSRGARRGGLRPGGSPDAGSQLPNLLRRAGLSDIALGRLEADPGWPGLLAMPLNRALVEVGLRLRQRSRPRGAPRPLTRAAFLGTAGCGRTTALCKWLGIEVFRKARTGHVVVAEFDRPNAAGPLPVLCEALGVPVARFPASTEAVTPGGFVYVDLPGMVIGDRAANAPIGDFLDRERIEQRVLVLNAAYDHSTLRAAYATGRELGATHLVFTHLDEVSQWGRLWEYLYDGGLEPLFLATGASLTGDCDGDVWSAVVRRTLDTGGGNSGQEEAPDGAGDLEPRSGAAASS